MARRSAAPKVEMGEPNPFGRALALNSPTIPDPETGKPMIAADGRLYHSRNHGWYNLPHCIKPGHRLWWKDFYGNIGCADCCPPLDSTGVCAEKFARPTHAEALRRVQEGRRMLAVAGV